MKTIRFTRRQWPYQAGEIAGFEDRLAERYVEDGAAEFHPTVAPEENEPLAVPPPALRAPARLRPRR